MSGVKCFVRYLNGSFDPQVTHGRGWGICSISCYSTALACFRSALHDRYLRQEILRRGWFITCVVSFSGGSLQNSSFVVYHGMIL